MRAALLISLLASPAFAQEDSQSRDDFGRAALEAAIPGGGAPALDPARAPEQGADTLQEGLRDLGALIDPEGAPPGPDVIADPEGAGAAEQEGPLVYPAVADAAPGASALLRALSFKTGVAQVIEVETGESAPFGPLTIQVDACLMDASGAPGAATAFLRITGPAPQEESAQAPKDEETTEAQDEDAPPLDANGAPLLFSGWMLASSPGLSAFDNPDYDIWLKGCAGGA